MSDQPRDPRTQQWQEKPRHGGTDDLEEFERVETLIIPREPVSRMPKWSDTEQPWSTCHRLGKYLLSGEDERSIRERALTELRETWGDDVMPVPDDEGEDEIGFMRRDNPTALFARDGLGYFMVDVDGTSKPKYRAVGNWVSRRTRRPCAYVRGMRLTTLVGAKAIYPKGERGGEDFAALVHESKYAWRLGMGFAERARKAWGEESNRELNRRYRNGTHAAGVFEDKMHCDKAHAAAAASSSFARRFAHVEIDDEVDLDRFAAISHEFEELLARRAVPDISPENSFRFRKTGRHRAIGVYSAGHRALAVDPRHPESGVHEMLHAWDYDGQNASTGEAFAPVLSAYQKDGLSHVPESRREYAATPTEVFARAGELYYVWSGRESSFTKPAEWYESQPLYQGLLPLRDDIIKAFDVLDTTGQRNA